MIPYDYIRKRVAEQQPSMQWDGIEPIEIWQERARSKLSELIGLDKMVRAEADLTIEFEHAHKAFREIRFRFQSEPGYDVPCHLLIPTGKEHQPSPTVICLQGHSKGMHISLGRTRFPDEKIEGDRDFAIRAVQEGFCALVMEQRNFGECGGDENGPRCESASMTNLLIGRTTIGERVWDIMRLIDVCADGDTPFADSIDPKNILILGNSGGGTATVYAAALERRLVGAIPSCAVSGFAASIGAMHHCTCNYVPGILNFFDMGELLGMIAPHKLVVVSGRNDEIFPLAGAEAMVNDARRVYRAFDAADRCKHVIGEGGHRFYADIAWNAYHSMDE